MKRMVTSTDNIKKEYIYEGTYSYTFNNTKHRVGTTKKYSTQSVSTEEATSNIIYRIKKELERKLGVDFKLIKVELDDKNGVMLDEEYYDSKIKEKASKSNNYHDPLGYFSSHMIAPKDVWIKQYKDLGITLSDIDFKRSIK